MGKKFYTRRWHYLDTLYDELSVCNEELQNNPDNEEVINKKLSILKEIKMFLRYGTPEPDFIS